jgi:multiple sugar transport system substrate-binding protein
MIEWVKAHPDWAIEPRIFTNSAGSLPGLLEEARAGRAPDCANLTPPFFAAFIDNGFLQPITGYLTEDEVQNFFPYVRESSTFDDEIYTYWLQTGTRVIYYRTDLVPQAPGTWDQVREFALAAKAEDPSVDGFLFNAGRWNGTYTDLIAWYWSQGGEVADEDGKPVFHEGDNREYMLNLLYFLKDLVDSDASPQRVVNITTYRDMVEAASNGTVAIFFSTSNSWSQMEEALPEEEMAKWAVAPMPGPSADQPGQAVCSGWSVGVLTEDGDKAAMCMDFVKTVFGPDWHAATGLLPPRRSEFEEAFDEPVFQVFAEGLEQGRTTPVLPYSAALSDAFNVMIGDVLTGVAAEEALDTMAETVQAAYEDSQQ